jgi:hypothetical protein
MIFGQSLQVLIDLPYILMLLVIVLSVFMAIKMRRKINKRLSDNKTKLEDILRSEISHHFAKLIFVYIIGGTIFTILFALYLLTTLCLVPWRLSLNYRRFKIIIEKVRVNYKDVSILTDVLRCLGRNLRDLFLDFVLLIVFATH